MKHMSLKLLIMTTIVVTQAQLNGQNPETIDREKIITAANAYIESIYDVDTTKVIEYIDKDLYKKGAYYSKAKGSWSINLMSFSDMIATAKTYNQKGRLPKNAPKEVKILDVQEKIANVMVKAYWGMDYLLLMKDENNEWKITQIQWQSYTPNDKKKMTANTNKQ
jgi:hypothetical protein